MRFLAYHLNQIHLRLSRREKHLIFFSTDTVLFLIAIYVSFCLRFDSYFPFSYISKYLEFCALIIPVKLIVFYMMGMYRPILRYTGVEFLSTALRTVLISSGILLIAAFWLQLPFFPRSIPIIDGVLTLFLVVGARLTMRWLAYDLQLLHHPNQALDRVLIYGAGNAGAQLATILKQEGNYRLVGFVDDNEELQRHHVQGVKVYSTESMPELIKSYGINTVLLAIPSATRQKKAEIVQYLQSLKVTIKTVPGINEILAGNVAVQELRDIDIIDLLGREEMLPHPELLQINITHKVVMVTGAGGSIGSELCRQIAQQNPRCLILYERNEFALYSIDLELSEHYPSLQKVVCIGSVTDAARLQEILSEHQVETLYHAAAYKHVPLIERNMNQGILNNIEGTLKVAQACMAERVATCVLVSTDKAVRPTNVMGATKRVAELILQALAVQEKSPTRFIMVRFGNVLDSAGSVVPLFRDQIRKGKPLTVTHPEITRYFMSIPEASRLVIQAGAMGQGGDVFLLDMGEPVKIYDLAVQMIELSGLKPGEDIEIKITGLRPGEKLYEELLIEKEIAVPTDHPKIFTAKEQMIRWPELSPLLNQLLQSAKNNEFNKMIWALQCIVPEYQPPVDVDLKLVRDKTAAKDQTMLLPVANLSDALLSLEAPELDMLKKYIREGNVQEAEKTLHGIKEKLPVGMRLYFEGALHGNRQQGREALKCYLKALSQLNTISNSDDRDYIYIRATRATAITKCKLGEDYEGAIQLLEELLHYPVVAYDAELAKQVRITRTVIHYYKGDYQTVIQELGWFVAQCPPDEHISLSQAYLFLALSHAQQNEESAVEVYFQQALSHFQKLSSKQLDNWHFLYGWMGWGKLTQELEQLVHEVVDRDFAENVMTSFQHGLTLYEIVNQNPARPLIQTEAIKQTIVEQLTQSKQSSKPSLKVYSIK